MISFNSSEISKALENFDIDVVSKEMFDFYEKYFEFAQKENELSIVKKYFSMIRKRVIVGGFKKSFEEKKADLYF